MSRLFGLIGVRQQRGTGAGDGGRRSLPFDSPERMLLPPSCAWFLPAFAVMMGSAVGVLALRALAARQYPRRPAWVYYVALVLLGLTLILFAALFLEALVASRSGARELCGLKF
jgi:hypothetical protein